MNELVSIITPNYNGENFIQETYKSIQAQTYSNWEWIIVDDCSTDESRKIIMGIVSSDPKVRPYFLSENQGAAAARNRALDASQGTFIAFLDMDDRWIPEKLKQSVQVMDENNLDFTYTNYFKNSSLISTPPAVTYDDLLKTCSICTSTVIIRRKLLGETRMNLGLRRGQDYLFWLELLQKNIQAVRATEQALTRYTVGHVSLSSNKLRKARGQWLIYRSYLKLNFLSSLYYFCHYAIYGFIKYKK